MLIIQAIVCFILFLWILCFVIAQFLATPAIDNKTGKLAPHRPQWPFLVKAFRGESQIPCFFEAKQKFGGIFQGWFGHRWVISVADPDMVKQVVTKVDLYQKASPEQIIGEMGRVFMNRNLLFANGDEWRRFRTIMNPAFHYDSLKNLIPAVQQCGQNLISRFKEESPGPIEITNLLTKVSVDIIAMTAFGSDFKSVLSRETPDHLKALIDCVDGIQDPIFFMVPWLSRYRLFTGKFYDNAAILDKLIYSLINKVSREPTTSNLLGMMLAAAVAEKDPSKSMSFKEIRDNLVLFFIAGQDTTSVSLGYTLYALGKHPDIQTKCRAEVEKFIPSDGLPTQEQLTKLEYIDLVIKESLRMYPPAVLFPLRKLAREDPNLCGYTIPKGAFVGVAPILIHRDPKYWDSPEVFDPERFTPERSVGRHPYAYIPFNQGPRSCIGNNFSIMEQKIILAQILHNFDLAVPDDFKFEFSRGAPVILHAKRIDLIMKRRT